MKEIIESFSFEVEESFDGKSLSENQFRVSKALKEFESFEKNFGRTHSAFSWSLILASNSTSEGSASELAAQITRKRQAMEEAKHGILLKQNKIKRHQKKIEESDNELDIEMWEIKISELNSQINNTLLYYQGAMKDVLELTNLHNQIMEKYGDMSEEDIEKAESKTHIRRALSQSIRDMRKFKFIDCGAQEYLEQLGINVSVVKKEIKFYLETEENHGDNSAGYESFLSYLVNKFSEMPCKKLELMGMKMGSRK